MKTPSQNPLDFRLEEVPKEIAEAAINVGIWMKKNGFDGWEFYDIADRRLVEHWRTKFEKLMKAVEAEPL